MNKLHFNKMWIILIGEYKIKFPNIVIDLEYIHTDGSTLLQNFKHIPN
jgi:hypothetical protein